jgi:hypothetical protein
MTPKGPWSRAEVDRFLTEARVPIRLAVNGSKGSPLLVSLWFVPIGGKLWCATQRDAKVADRIARDGRCAFEVAPDCLPYRGVRGRALAELDAAHGREVLELLIERYLGDRSSTLARWLLGRADRETAISIDPRTLFSWDYSGRMRAESVG